MNAFMIFPKKTDQRINQGSPNLRYLKTIFYCQISGLMLLNSCSFIPTYKQPALPVSREYNADTWLPLNTSQDNLMAVDTSWEMYFSNKNLHSLIALALGNSRDLHVAILRIEEARAAYGIQRADQFPSIAIATDLTRSRTPGDLNLTGKSLVLSQYQLGLGLSTWELDFWGRVRSLKEAALENYLATDEARNAFATSLIMQVADGYLSIRELNERIVLAGQTIASRQQSFHIFTRRFEVGSISRMDLTQVETLLNQAQLLASQLEQAKAAQTHALTLLVGSPLPDLADDAQEVVFQELRVGLPSDLLMQRPDIIAAEHRLKASNANIGAARAAFFPRITLTGSAGTASTELEGLFSSGSRAWRFMPSLSLPIFDGGRNRSGLDLALTRRDLAITAYEKTIQSAFREVSDALSARHWLTEQLHIQEATLKAQSERSRLATLRYDNGAALYLEVLDAQRELLVSEQQLVQTRRLLLSSQLSLYAALGGGSQGSSNLIPSDVQRFIKARDSK